MLGIAWDLIDDSSVVQAKCFIAAPFLVPLASGVLGALLQCPGLALSMSIARRAATAIGVAWLLMTPLYARAVGADFGVQAARAAFVYRAQATQNAALKALDDDLLDQRRRADALDGELAAARSAFQQAQKDATGSRGRVVQLQQHLVQLGHDAAVAQDRFATALAAKDADYARALETLRSAADEILATPDGLHVLELNNAGDWAGVKVIEAALRTARQKAREAAEAADARAFAVLALDNAEKGRETHAAVIARFEEVTRLDPSHYDDWATLSSLLLEANDLTDARRAATMAEQTAKTDGERIAITRIFGDIEAAGGHEGSALDRYRAAVAAARHVAGADSTSLMAQRVLLGALTDLIKALEQTHRRGEAVAVSHEAVGIATVLLRSGHSTTSDVGAFLRLAFAMAQQLLAADKTDAALEIANNALEVGTTLAAVHPDAVALQSDIAAGLTQIGDIYSTRGDTVLARAAYQRALEIDRATLAKDPTYADGRARLLADLDRLAQLRAASGDLPAALALLRENLRVARDLLASGPSAVANQIALALTQDHIAAILLAQHDVPGAAYAVREAHTILAAAASSGTGTELLRGAMSETLREVATIAAKVGDQAGALRDQSEAATLSVALLRDDPSSAIAIHEVISNHRALALLGSDPSWAAVVSELEMFQKTGRLAPRDAWMLADARVHSAKDRP